MADPTRRKRAVPSSCRPRVGVSRSEGGGTHMKSATYRDLGGNGPAAFLLQNFNLLRTNTHARLTP